jgi:hypothetical protein
LSAAASCDLDQAEPYEPTEEDVGVAARWLAKHAAMAASDQAEFFQFVMKEETSRERLRIAPHQELVLAFVLAHPKCIVRAPVGFTKTYLMLALTLFFLGEDCTQRGVVASSVQGQSKKVVGAARTYIEASDELALVFPELLPTKRSGEPWTQVAITVDRPMGIRDPSLVAVGIGGKLPGSRISWILADDLLNAENTASEEGRAHTKTWVTSTLLDRLDATDARIVLCNVPWVPKTSPESTGDITYELEADPFSWPSLTLDAYGDVDIRNTDWDSPLIRPAHGPNPEGVRHRLTAHDDPRYALYAGEDPKPGWVDVEDQVPLWPEKFPAHVLDEMRTRLGPVDFMRAVRCKPRSALTVAERTQWINLCKQAAIAEGRHRLVDSLAPGPTRITAVDPAFGKRKKSNRSAVLTFEVLGDGRRVVLENRVGRWGGSELGDVVISAVGRFGSVAVVEGNAAQRWLRDIVRLKKKTIPIQVAITGANKNDPRFGVESIFIELEQGLWLLPNEGRLEGVTFVPGKALAGVDDLVSDLLEYSPKEHTGDSLMAMWIGREFARKKGLLDPAIGELNDDVSGFAAIGAR